MLEVEGKSSLIKFLPCLLSTCISRCKLNHLWVSYNVGSTSETQESMNNVSCRRDMTEILLKAA